MPKLTSSIKILPGVGPKMAVCLEKLGIETIRDLVYYYPRVWQDFSQFRPVVGLRLDEEVIIKAKIVSVSEVRTKRKWMSLIEVVLSDDAGDELKAVWFNQPFLKNVLKVGDEWLFLGKVGWDFKNKCKTFSPTQMEKDPVILPIYSETAGLTSKFLRKIIRPILSGFDEPDFLPDEILKENDLVNLKTAIFNIHFPLSQIELKKAKKRLAFNELFLIALRFLTIKKELQQNKAPQMIIDKNLLKQFVGDLPYKLTDAQRKSAWEIIKDLARQIPMNRLLQGDVGSGKTVVAAMAALTATNNKYQVVWLAPTEILANQHFQNVTKLLEPFNVKVGLMTSANRKADLEHDDLIIGTHALIQKNIEIPNLGLIIIDEQHRFGVKQRAYLRQHRTTDYGLPTTDVIPHLLSMTATPIPRTLALALYGDLDLSIIDQMPPGRQKVITQFVEDKNRQQIYDFMKKEIAAGRQAFVVCPLIELKESNMINLFESDKKSVMAEYEKLSKSVFPGLSIGLLHGKMKPVEKALAMEKFKNNETQILVSTAVVEVGIDIKNATIMMIESADRFGLAQLHQFRGRVGRGTDQSYCFLFSDSESAKTKERLEAMENCFDGFTLAELDLKFRGAGEVVGLRQSGLADLKIASLSDTIIVKDARLAAQKVVDCGIENFSELAKKLKEFEIRRHLE
jgi:ATP-dependent DNA helicase RecG